MANQYGKKWVNATTTCEWCGKVQPFPRPLSSGAFSYVQHRFCSNMCRTTALHKEGAFDSCKPKSPPTFTCPTCRKLTQRRYNKATQGYDYHQKFCSKTCGDASRRTGRIIDKAGYVLLSKDRNGYHQPEHRAVMEKMLGRKLKSNETVHHKNGIKTDNRPDNLELWASRHPRGQRTTDEDIWSGMISSWQINAVV